MNARRSLLASLLLSVVASAFFLVGLESLARVLEKKAVPQVLESRLRSQGRRIEVMNFALWGWSTRQERTAYTRPARATGGGPSGVTRSARRT